MAYHPLRFLQLLLLKGDVDNLQAITDIAETILDKVCREVKVEKQFLYTETISINVDKIEWDNDDKIHKAGKQ